MAALTLAKTYTRRFVKVVAASLALLLARALVAKRRFHNAKLIWLIKRYLMGIFVRVVPISSPEIISGAGATSSIAEKLRKRGCCKPLLVTDKVIVQHGLLDECIKSLQSAGMKHELFDSVVCDPPVECVDAGDTLYRRNACDSIVAVGGGSSMDCAKIIGVKVANPKPVEEYQGFFKCTSFGLTPIPPMIVVPTTAGTGSETSVAAVITDKKDNSKLVIVDQGIVPDFAVLDPKLLLQLPKSVTASTGMDALSHAVEAYLGGIGQVVSRELALSATQKIFQSLLTSYRDGSDCAAREAMLHAAFEAGSAMTKTNVGYVHAIAHQLGVLYHLPHGTAIATVMPHVLDFYLRDDGRSTQDWTAEQICNLAVAAGVASLAADANRDVIRQTAKKFVASIREMNAEMCIPSVVAEMKATDVHTIAAGARTEAHGNRHPLLSMNYMLDMGYPVPMYISHADCIEIVTKLLPDEQLELLGIAAA